MVLNPSLTQTRSSLSTKRVLYLLIACILVSLLWFNSARGLSPLPDSTHSKLKFPSMQHESKQSSASLPSQGSEAVPTATTDDDAYVIVEAIETVMEVVQETVHA